MNKIMTTLFMCLFLTTGLLQAMPPREGIVLDKEQMELMQKLGIDSPKNGILQSEIKLGRTKISGNRNYPVVTGDFTDTVHIYTNAAMQTNLFNTGAGVKSVNNYYRDMSYNAMSCSGSVFNWVSSGNTRAYFGNNAGGLTDGTTKNTYEFILKTLQACDAAVNFANPSFDSNNDDTVDVLWVIHAGRGREETGLNADIHSHSFWLTGFTGGVPYVTGDVNSRGKNVRINI
ncbi:immune inhibitor A [candidate division TA06 bacterium]|nr:immune inhibitor A [candidate division TA06 bacterium]